MFDSNSRNVILSSCSLVWSDVKLINNAQLEVSLVWSDVKLINNAQLEVSSSQYYSQTGIVVTGSGGFFFIIIRPI